MTNKFIVLITCAGVGSRFASQVPKQYNLLGKQTVLMHTLTAFLLVPRVTKIIILASVDDNHIDQYSEVSTKISIQKIGGATRAKTVLNGLNTIQCADNDWILVHDAARCCITAKYIDKLIDTLTDDPVGGLLALKVNDTVKQGNSGVIQKTLNRDQIYLAQTPQMFRYHILHKALSVADLDTITDDASAVENLDLAVKLVEGDATNIKVTYQRDLQLAKLFLAINQVTC